MQKVRTIQDITALKKGDEIFIFKRGVYEARIFEAVEGREIYFKNEYTNNKGEFEVDLFSADFEKILSPPVGWGMYNGIFDEKKAYEISYKFHRSEARRIKNILKKI